MHPLLSQEKLLRFVAEKDIKVVAFSPLVPASYVEIGMATSEQSIEPHFRQLDDVVQLELRVDGEIGAPSLPGCLRRPFHRRSRTWRLRHMDTNIAVSNRMLLGSRAG
jgi:hypothetical protein